MVWQLQIWFATGNGWTPKSDFVSYSAAMKLANGWSDAKGIRLVSAAGAVAEIRVPNGYAAIRAAHAPPSLF